MLSEVSVLPDVHVYFCQVLFSSIKLPLILFSTLLFTAINLVALDFVLATVVTCRSLISPMLTYTRGALSLMWDITGSPSPLGAKKCWLYRGVPEWDKVLMPLQKVKISSRRPGVVLAELH
ncbi:unnamed protein product [Bubo scandiacus]